MVFHFKIRMRHNLRGNICQNFFSFFFVVINVWRFKFVLHSHNSVGQIKMGSSLLTNVIFIFTHFPYRMLFVARTMFCMDGAVISMHFVINAYTLLDLKRNNKNLLTSFLFLLGERNASDSNQIYICTDLNSVTEKFIYHDWKSQS